MASPGSDGAAKDEHLQTSSSSSSNSASSSTSTEPISLTIPVLEEITDSFSQERAVGQGSYGKVYRGMLGSEEIAVKVLYNNMPAINDEQFKHEFDNLMMLNHKNIVRLVGYCYETRRQHMEFQGKPIFAETTYRALCFEYMPRGSLQTQLCDEMVGLDWHTRYKIIKGICDCLKYLHEGFKEPIFHLDLKPDNILLDMDMVPKLADFGLSKLFGEEQTRATQSNIGTIGYLPPEYLFAQLVSMKFDIFSLGVIITKIIAGPKGNTRSADMPCQEFLDQFGAMPSVVGEAGSAGRCALEDRDDDGQRRFFHPPLLNKPRMRLDAVVLFRSGRHGDEQERGSTESSSIGEVGEASMAEVPKRRRGAPPLSLTKGVTPHLGVSYSEVSSSSKMGGSLAPARRLNIGSNSSGFVPGMELAASASRPAMATVEKGRIAFQDFLRGSFCNLQGLWCNFLFIWVPIVTLSHRYE